MFSPSKAVASLARQDSSDSHESHRLLKKQFSCSLDMLIAVDRTFHRLGGLLESRISAAAVVNAMAALGASSRRRLAADDSAAPPLTVSLLARFLPGSFVCLPVACNDTCKMFSGAQWKSI